MNILPELLYESERPGFQGAGTPDRPEVQGELSKSVTDATGEAAWTALYHLRSRTFGQTNTDYKAKSEKSSESIHTPREILAEK